MVSPTQLRIHLLSNNKRIIRILSRLETALKLIKTLHNLILLRIAHRNLAQKFIKLDGIPTLCCRPH